MAEENDFTGESGETTEEQAGQPVEPADVWAILRYAVMLFQAFAWQSLGLMPDPATGQTKQDLEQAKIAIDTVAFMVGLLESKLEGHELRDLRAMVSDLRMNYIQQSSSSQS